MIEYKYKKRENKFTENGHTMFEFDVLQRLKRLAYLEEQIKQGQLLPIDSVSQQSELLKAYDEFAETEHCWYIGTEDETKENFLKAFNCL